MTIAAHITRRLEVPPSETQVALTEWQQGLPLIGGTCGRLRSAPGIWVAAEPERASSDPLELFETRGIMWVRIWPLRVRLEGRVWSETETELSLCSMNLTWPVGTTSYIRAASEALESLAGTLLATAERNKHQTEPTHQLEPALKRVSALTAA